MTTETPKQAAIRAATEQARETAVALDAAIRRSTPATSAATPTRDDVDTAWADPDTTPAALWRITAHHWAAAMTTGDATPEECAAALADAWTACAHRAATTPHAFDRRPPLASDLGRPRTARSIAEYGARTLDAIQHERATGETTDPTDRLQSVWQAVLSYGLGELAEQQAPRQAVRR